ncbi:MAG: SET domain-containing protein-lysine N-methyltransferase [Chloroflexi bacterium]|nr:SET domain-containing protein-lysine N-methyltransferase [Chloroflexota bacterium]
MQYPEISWIDPRIESRPSLIHGRGLFATAPIAVGDVVTIWGGVLFTSEQIANFAARMYSHAPVEDGLYLGTPVDGPESPDELINHSCDPNVWPVDSITFVARRDVLPGEELTVDYATFSEPGWVAPWLCECGASLCRRGITGRDYRLHDLRERYGDHWTPYVRRHIEADKRN